MNKIDLPPWSAGSESEWEIYWRLAKPHREMVTALLLNAMDRPDQSNTICLWGAGSCHDIDLSQLLKHCEELTLVDLDRRNLSYGLQYQLGDSTDRVKVIAPLDLAGVPAEGDHAAATAALSQHEVSELGEYDVVASLGMLSQIVLDVVRAYGFESPASGPAAPISQRLTTNSQVVAALTAVRRRHFALMTQHLKPGGKGLAVIDFVNSGDTPALAEVDDLESAVQQAMADLPAPSVLSPQRVHHDLLIHPLLSKQVTDVSVSKYWLWRMPKSSFACYATQFKKRNSSTIL